MTLDNKVENGPEGRMQIGRSQFGLAYLYLSIIQRGSEQYERNRRQDPKDKALSGGGTATEAEEVERALLGSIVSRALIGWAYS